jgi:hypothetical protein
MRRERRQPTRREWQLITSPTSPVVRRVLSRRRSVEKPERPLFSADLTNNNKASENRP